MIEQGQNTYALKSLEDYWLRILRPPPRLTVSEWAENYRELSKESSAKAGKFRAYPYQKEMLDDASDPNAQSATWMLASQLCKTESLNCVVGYYIHQDPSPILYVQPTLEMGETIMKDRIAPMLRDTPALRGLVKDARSRDSGNTIMHKSFPGGHLTCCGANSPASLASRPIRVLLCDEVDRYPDSAGEEGDPTSLANKRTETFWNAVKIYVSTPTVKGKSRIEKMFLAGDQQRWFVTCNGCGCEQTLKWGQVKWEEDKPETAWYECERCGARYDDKARRRMIEQGRWKATAPDTGKRSRHLSGLYSLAKQQRGFKNSLHQFAVGFLDAKHAGKESMRAWVNTFLAETWQDDEDAKADWQNLYNRREEFPKEGLPKEIRLISCGVDVQNDRLEISFIGFGAGERSWVIAHEVFSGDPRQPEIWGRLEASTLRDFKREDGAILRVRCVGIDTGFHASRRMAYEFIRPRQSRRWFALKGSHIPDAPEVNRSKATKVERVSLITIGTNRVKATIYDRANNELPESVGFIHFNAALPEYYFKQLLSESSYPVFKNGARFRRFECQQGTRNEALDCFVYAMGAVYALGVLHWDYEESLVLKTIPTPEKPAANPLFVQREKPSFLGPTSNFRI